MSSPSWEWDSYTNYCEMIVDPIEEMAPDPNRVVIVELADELQVRKQWLFKIIKRLSIKVGSHRDPDRRNQAVATVTKLEAEAIMREVSAFRGRNVSSVGSDGVEFDAEIGYFYIIQLEPDHDPGRIKVGFTTELDGRIRKHRCSAPFAVYAKSWPCRRSWERTAMDCVTLGTEQLHTEVFRAESIEELVNRGNRFFGVMPNVGLPETNAEESDDCHARPIQR